MKTIQRHHLSSLFSIGLCTILLSLNLKSVAQPFNNPLFIPDTLSGTVFNLDVSPSKKAFLPGDSTNTFGINGDYLGPTLMMNEGDFIQLNVTNNIGETTTMHWHGMHVAPEDDGGPGTPILAGETWSPDFTVLDEATTFWYHPHLHHKTADHVNRGAAGMIIVRDDNPVGAQLPHRYGIDEFPLIIQDKSFDANNEFIYTELADTMMVNGTLSAYLDVPAQMVRFHLLNASLQRIYNLGLPPNLNVWQIGSDGGLLEQPLPMSRIQLTPGERAEIVIDFRGQPNNIVRLVAFNSEVGDGLSGGPMGPPRGGGRGPSPLDGVDFEVMEFRIGPPTANPITNLPNNLNTITPFLEADADVYRTKVFTVDSSGFPFYINGTTMDMNVINDTVILDDIEVWSIVNNTDVAHPWHIHDIQFYILDIDGNPPPPHLRGKKDVIIIEPNQTVRYITKFDDFTSDTIPYMFHCHNLFHEDGGMMGQFIVVNATGIQENPFDRSSYSVYPNPTNGRVQILSDGRTLMKVIATETYDRNGRFLIREPHVNVSNRLDVNLDEYPAGVYFVQLIGKDGDRHTLKVVKTD